MSELSVSPSAHDFSPVRDAMQRYVDRELLAGVSWAILRGRDLLDVGCAGWADREGAVPLRTDHVFRAMSGTKLVTTAAVLLLWEEGRFALDDAIERFIPQLGRLQVLRPGATRLDDTEPMRGAITVRHLLTHTSGLSYGLLDPGTLLFQAYNERRVLSVRQPIAKMIDTLAGLPLLFQPGTAFEYSVSLDVLGYLIEVVTGQTLARFCAERIFGPLGMVDSGFVLPESLRGRLTAYYAGADLADPLAPGLTRMEKTPWAGGSAQPPAWASGGGGLHTTLPDTVALLRGLTPGGTALLRPATLASMSENHLPQGVQPSFPPFGVLPGKGFGLGGAVTLAPAPHEPAASAGDLQWGGLAGTHWWISPRTGLAGVTMAQRHLGFWHPYYFELRRLAYQAAGH